MPFARIRSQNVFHTWTPAAHAKATLLLIHGLGSSSSFYGAVVHELVQKGFSCLALDVPGSGLSRSDGEAPTPQGAAETALELLASLGQEAERTIVVGHSMGALIASQVALRASVLGVALIGPVHPSSSLADVFTARMKTVAQNGNLEALADAVPSAATGSAATATQRSFIRTLILSQDPTEYALVCKMIAEAEAPDYARIRTPLLILAGSEDKTSPLAGCLHIKESWGDKVGAELAVLDKVGHWHCIENPDEVARLLGAFASKLSAA